MPVKIRLTRVGKKKQPTYRVVVVDSRKPRDGAHIEQIGRYDPRQDPSVVHIDNDRALTWLQRGAQPTERARKLLEISGAWARFRVARGEIHTIEEAPPPLPPVAVAPEPAAPDEATEALAEVEASGGDEAPVSDAPVVEVEASGGDDTPLSDSPVVEVEASGGDDTLVSDSPVVEVEASGGDDTPVSDAPVIEVEASGGDDTPVSDAPVVDAVDVSDAEDEREDEAAAEADVSEEPL